MSLFQASVSNKYLKAMDRQSINAAYTLFKAHFHNSSIQENIRLAKEEQYQGEFLIDLFVNVLGYIKNPSPNYNLTTEYKNVKDSKKADGAIVFCEKVKAVIELKGTNTTDLGNVEVQAFGYKNNQPECTYVITSNFEKLRFYIDNAIEYLEFNLFTLSEKDFELLYLCLSAQSIENDLPKKIKAESVSREDDITKKLYRDYSLFKSDLHTNLVENNPEYDALLLFNKSQKLLSRLLFLFFAEDRQLLPPNSVRLILNDWRELQERDVEIPLYDRFKKYFEYLNTGYKGKRYDVFAYNGGLFKPDEVLDSVQIDDELLFRHTSKLSDYDFESEVDVNILGHIFENSLNELDELKAQIEGTGKLTGVSKRKKDGVFYTPKYITKYIVDNTVGRLCQEKKAELGIVEDDFLTMGLAQLGQTPKTMGHAPLHRKAKQILYNKLTAYREWLLQITICDPACGSGAFLNQALNFLIAEHRNIDEMQAKLSGHSLIMSDIENTILENNLFGVDLNEESVEIAKLSLWLRTAQPSRKLNNLSNNIKCGNSLIDDPAIASEKAFNWEREFPQVFGKKAIEQEISIVDKTEKPDYLKLVQEKLLDSQAKAEQALELSKQALEISKQAYEYAGKLENVSEPPPKYLTQNGGFDVVIGNPPYVNINLMPQIHNYLKENYSEIHTGYNDLMYYFLHKGISLLNSNGVYGVITSNYFIGNEYAGKLRQFLNKHIEKLVNFENTLIFEDANVHTSIILAKKTNVHPKIEFLTYIENKPITEINTSVNYSICELERSNQSEKWLIANISNQLIIEKLIENSILLGDVCDIAKGSESGKNDIFTVDVITINKYLIERNVLRKCIKNSDVLKYNILQGDNFLIYADNDFSKEKYPNAYRYLEKHKEILLDRRGPKSNEYEWWRLHRPSIKEIFEAKEKILVPYRANKNRFAYDNQQLFNNGGDIRAIIMKENAYFELKYLLALLNSNLLDWFFGFIGKPKGDSREYFNKPLSEIPIKNISLSDQQPFIEKADQMLTLNQELKEVDNKFKRNIVREFAPMLDEGLTRKLEDWYIGSYGDFLKELEKKKILLTLTQKADFEDYFLPELERANNLRLQIQRTDREIDLMVYALYNLTEEEIAIVENT